MPTPHLTKPLNRQLLAQRWQAMCADPAFNDVLGKVELNEWGDVLMNPPVGKTHAIAAMALGSRLMQQLGGHAMGEAGFLTPAGVRVPHVAWCSDAWLETHPEEAPLLSAPELCIEIMSPSNSRAELRRKAQAYLAAGALEAWIVSPADRTVEIHTPAGQTESTTFPLNLQTLFRD